MGIEFGFNLLIAVIQPLRTDESLYESTLATNITKGHMLQQQTRDTTKALGLLLVFHFARQLQHN